MPKRSFSRRSTDHSITEIGSGSVLNSAERTFALLVTRPHPVSLDGRAFAGLPDRAVPLDELKELLLRRQCPRGVRDAVWAELVRRARVQGSTWTVACVGIALPGLITLADSLMRAWADDYDDVYSAVLVGFLAALDTVDLAQPWILPRLRYAARHAAVATIRDALRFPIPADVGFESHPPRLPAEHPDLVLARAVADRVITSEQAELISATRVGDESVAAFARRHGRSYEALRKSRQRAERALVAWLNGSDDPNATPRRSCQPPVSGCRTTHRRPRGVSRPPATGARKSRRPMSRNAPRNRN